MYTCTRVYVSSPLEEEARVICCKTMELVERSYDRGPMRGAFRRGHDAQYPRVHASVSPVTIGPFLVVFIRFAADHATVRVATVAAALPLSPGTKAARGTESEL